MSGLDNELTELEKFHDELIELVERYGYHIFSRIDDNGGEITLFKDPKKNISKKTVSRILKKD